MLRRPLTLVATLAGVLPIFAPLEFDAPSREAPVRQPAVPTAAGHRAASDYAGTRPGLVSFAYVDSRGRLSGREPDRLYPGASVVKAMILAAELRRLAEEGASLDSGTRSALSAMIRFSDNDAADAVYARIGDAGLWDVADRAGMTGFQVAGHWGNAQITAGDMARLFAELDRVLPRRHRAYALRLLESITASQSWGIPTVATGWEAYFKGGWLPEKALVHQAAALREQPGTRAVALAILTDQQPSFGDGVETVEGVASRLLAAP
jgi:hypothetical protein